MTENKWHQFAGFLNECLFDLNHEECPYNKYRALDQFQQLEQLLVMSDKEADRIMKTCIKHRSECKPLIVHEYDRLWKLATAV